MEEKEKRSTIKYFAPDAIAYKNLGNHRVIQLNRNWAMGSFSNYQTSVYIYHNRCHDGQSKGIDVVWKTNTINACSNCSETFPASLKEKVNFLMNW